MTDSKTVVEDLAAWLTRIWDAEERLAKAAPGRQWHAFVMDDVAGASVYDEQWVLLYPQHYDHDNPLSSEPDATGPLYIEHAVDELCAHIARHDPASVLARIAADRKILALHKPAKPPWPTAMERGCTTCLTPQGWDDKAREANCATLRLLASPYADRPGFRPEWLVERQGVER